MSFSHSHKVPTGLSRDSLTVVASGASAFLGLITVVGWHTHQIALIQAGPQFAPFTYNAALGFFLLGMAGLAVLSQRSSIGLFFGSLAMILGFGSLCQDLFLKSLGIDQMLMEAYLVFPSAPPGRMAPATAVSLFLGGLSFLLGKREIRWVPSLQSFFGVIIAAVGFVGFFGYLAKLSGVIRWGLAGPLSVQEALGLTLVGLGIASLGWRRELERGVAMLHWLPLQFGLGILVATAMIHYALESREHEKFEEFMARNGLGLRNEILARMEAQVAPLVNLVRRWEVDFTPRSQRLQELRRQSKLASTFRNLQWLSPYSLKNEVRDHVTKALLRRQSVLVSTNETDAGELQLFVPIFAGRSHDGYLTARFRIQEMMAYLLQDNIASGFSIGLWEGRTELFRRPDGLSDDGDTQRKGVSIPLSFFGKLWAVNVWPSARTLEKEKTWLPAAVSFLGVLSALMFSGMIWLLQTSRLRARETELANRDLKDEIAERERVQAELEKASEAALQGARAKSEFLANMSHEIRTPLNAVIGMSALLSDTKLNGEQKDLVKTVQYSADTLLTLINDILDFSKIEAGKLELEKIDFDLSELIMSSSLMLRSSAETKGLKLRTSVSSQLPLALKGDPIRLRQVIINLVNNAIKFTDSGEVTLSVMPCSRKNTHGARFVVTDTGIGIPEGAQARLFNAFSQADSSTTRKYGGTGLGLSICKRLVELMSGSIGFQSVEGKGSTFWFEVPLEKGSVPKISPVRMKPKRGLKKQKLMFLVAEDNPINQKVVSKMLKKLGYPCLIVSNGREALSAIEKGKFHLIFMDCQMPELDGYEATRRLRLKEQGSRDRLPIIALTAHALTEDRQKCLNAGMDDFLTKPIDIKQLEATITRWLDAAPSAAIPLAQTKAEAPSSGPIDDKVIEELLSLADTGEELVFLEEMVRMFKQGSAEALAMLTESAERKNTELWCQVAHKLKSGAGNLGAMKMAGMCKEMETLGKQGRFDQAVMLLPRLQKEFLGACEDLDRRISRLGKLSRKAA